MASGPQPDILSLHAQNQPDRTALICAGQEVTFAQLNGRANRVAHAVAALGAQPDDRAAVMAYNSIAGYEISGGLRKAGLIGVPINFRLRGPEVAYILNDSGASIVFAGPEFVPVVEAARTEVEGERHYIAIGAADPPPGWLRYEELLATAEETEASGGGMLGASMIYTSGTTGHPKGAFRKQGVGLELALQSIQIFGLRPDDVHLMAGPGYHSAVGYFSLLTILLGGTVVVMPKFDAEQALRLIAERRCTTTFMAPVLVQRILDLPEEVRARYDSSSLRALIVGAAPFPFSLKERAVAAFPDALFEFYGATETGVNLVLRPEEQLLKPGSCGRPTETTEILLLDDDGRPVRDGEPGLLWVRNSSLATYYNNPEATERSQRDGFFTVGDIAYRDTDGYYYICDRKIDMVISGGVNIYPAEVEAALHAHPAVRDAAVIGVPDADWGESVKAVVALQPGAAAGEQELIDWCGERLADYKRPRSVDFVAELPRDQAGKLLKRKIREPYWEGAGRRI
ncbi:MAG TPA: AMP-binding protein [Candidatus Dormibacteraeota bacterium]